MDMSSRGNGLEQQALYQVFENSIFYVSTLEDRREVNNICSYCSSDAKYESVCGLCEIEQ